MGVIEVKNLVKVFRSPLPAKKGFLSGVKNYFAPRYQTLTAVNNISFTVQPGERVAFIGPNGAGKSTTIKILTGIMRPTSGSVSVLNKIPGVERKQLAYQIGAVFGQRSQLWYHLPVQETFSLFATIYDIPHSVYQQRLKALSNQFDLAPLLHKPVRQLSLGERMRCEVVASLLHEPAVLFLDEPTIGLDITAKAIIRDLIRKQSIEKGVTLLLTSHDTDDIEKVCDRVIIIDQGKLLLDDSLSNLKTKYIRKKVISIVTEEAEVNWDKHTAKIMECSSHHLKLEVDNNEHSAEAVIRYLLEKNKVKDLMIEGPPLETIIQTIYQQGHYAQ